MLRILHSLPFAPVVALMLAGAVFSLVLAMPVAPLEQMVAQIGLADFIAAAHPPLGLTARILSGLAAAVLVGVPVYVLARLPGQILRARRRFVVIPARPIGLAFEDDLLRVGPQATDGRPAFPQFLTSEAAACIDETRAEDVLILRPDMVVAAPPPASPPPAAPSLGRRHAVLSIVSNADAGGRDAGDVSTPVYLPQPDPVLIIEPAPVPPPLSGGHMAPDAVSAACAAPEAPTMRDLVARFERGLADLRDQGRLPADDQHLQAALSRLELAAVR